MTRQRVWCVLTLVLSPCDNSCRCRHRRRSRCRHRLCKNDDDDSLCVCGAKRHKCDTTNAPHPSNTLGNQCVTLVARWFPRVNCRCAFLSLLGEHDVSCSPFLRKTGLIQKTNGSTALLKAVESNFLNNLNTFYI